MGIPFLINDYTCPNNNLLSDFLWAPNLNLNYVLKRETWFSVLSLTHNLRIPKWIRFKKTPMKLLTLKAQQLGGGRPDTLI